MIDGLGITSLKAQTLSRSSKKKFDITPVVGTRKARHHRLAILFPVDYKRGSNSFEIDSASSKAL